MDTRKCSSLKLQCEQYLLLSANYDLTFHLLEYWIFILMTKSASSEMTFQKRVCHLHTLNYLIYVIVHNVLSLSLKVTHVFHYIPQKAVFFTIIQRTYSHTKSVSFTHLQAQIFHTCPFQTLTHIPELKKGRVLAGHHHSPFYCQSYCFCFKRYIVSDFFVFSFKE